MDAVGGHATSTGAGANSCARSRPRAEDLEDERRKRTRCFEFNSKINCLENVAFSIFYSVFLQSFFTITSAAPSTHGFAVRQA